jgi:hypothetical protein
MNICFLTRADNNLIKDKSPSNYNKLINSKHRKLYLASALIPLNFNRQDYALFLKERKSLLEKKAMELMGK